MLIVQKFGGSSLADTERMRRAAVITATAFRREQQVLAVVSACGDTTDSLHSMAGNISEDSNSRELDSLLSTGEQQSAALMALMLQSMGIPARSFTGYQAGIFTEGPHGAAKIALILPDRIKKALDEGILPVVAGFQGMNFHGDICTLGRGGSDTTAVALSAALGAERCEIYTDVDGIYTSDPRLVSGARYLKEVDYRDMLLLSRCGSQVLHPDSIRFAMANNLDIRLLSAFKSSAGSRLCFMDESKRPAITGVTRDREKSSISAVGRAAGPQTLSELMLMLGRAGVPVLSGSAEKDCVSVLVAREQLLPALQLVHSALIK